MKVTSKLPRMGALHEIHIFLGGSTSGGGVSEEDVTKALRDTEEYNCLYPRDDKMKMCYLTLAFARNPLCLADATTEHRFEPVAILQSARYVRDDDQDEVGKQALFDADFFRERGWNVVRSKIEANVHCNHGVEEVRGDEYYYEFHIKVAKNDQPANDANSVHPATKEEIQELFEISRQMSILCGVPVALSWNALGNPQGYENPGHQRFLNVRFSETTLDDALEKVAKICNAIAEKTDHRVLKTIAECVLRDTLRGMDDGWIEYNRHPRS